MATTLHRSGITLAIIIMLIPALAFANGGNGSPQKGGTVSPTGTIQSIRANLYIVESDVSLVMADGILVDYGSQYSNAVDWDDAPKFLNNFINVSSLRDGSLLAIERRHTMANCDTLFLNVTGLSNLRYRWVFQGIDIQAPGRHAYVRDNYLGQNMLINLDLPTEIDFSGNQDPASVASNRFSLYFATASVVPVTFTATGLRKEQNAGYKIYWQVENEVDITHYELEKKLPAGNFTKLATVLFSAVAKGSYMVMDKPAAQESWYRIKAVEKNGQIYYSDIVMAKGENSKPIVQVIPGTTTGRIVLDYQGLIPGDYQLTILSMNGQVLRTEKWNNLQTTGQYKVRLPVCERGLYVLVIGSVAGKYAVPFQQL